MRTEFDDNKDETINGVNCPIDDCSVGSPDESDIPKPCN